MVQACGIVRHGNKIGINDQIKTGLKLFLWPLSFWTADFRQLKLLKRDSPNGFVFCVIQWYSCVMNLRELQSWWGFKSSIAGSRTVAPAGGFTTFSWHFLGRLSNSNTSRFSEGLLISYYLGFLGELLIISGSSLHVSKIWNNNKNHTSVASPGLKNRRSFSRAADHIFFCWPSAWRCLRFHSSRFCCANLAPSWAVGPWSEPFLYSVV